MAVANSINQSTTGITGFTGTAFTGTPVTQYNVLTGAATSSALNNVAPSTSGIPLVSSGAAVQPAFSTAVVAGGGTGNNTFTAYSVIAAGTTSTGAFQNVSGLGSSTNVLKSNGAAALPSWQAASGGSAILFSLQTGIASPLDGITYYIQSTALITTYTASNNSSRYYMPVAGTINKVYGGLVVAGTLGSTQNATLAIRKNDSSNSNVTATLQFNAAAATFNNTSLGLSVAAGDYVEVILICPTWNPNPTNCSISLSFLVE